LAINRAVNFLPDGAETEEIKSMTIGGVTLDKGLAIYIN
jgi:hypothetical protein